MDPQPAFALIAELALALAGFGGVAAAFGGRDRSYAPVEISRLRVLFSHAFLALSTSLFAIGLLFSRSVEIACLWASIAGVLSQTPTSAYFIHRVYGHTANQETTGLVGFRFFTGRNGRDPALVRCERRIGRQSRILALRDGDATDLWPMDLHSPAASPQLDRTMRRLSDDESSHSSGNLSRLRARVRSRGRGFRASDTGKARRSAAHRRKAESFVGCT